MLARRSCWTPTAPARAGCCGSWLGAPGASAFAPRLTLALPARSIGERLSPYVSLGCILMGISTLMY